MEIIVHKKEKFPIRICGEGEFDFLEGIRGGTCEICSELGEK